MIFAAPIWLLAPLPWGALLAWLMRKRPPARGVPFLPLWRGTIATQRAGGARRLPPPPVLAVLAGLLLAVLAAGRPALPWMGASDHQITIVVDRGITMSAQQTGVRRYADHARQMQPRLESLLGSRAKVRLVDAPSSTDRIITLSELAQAIASLPPSAVETDASLGPAIDSQLRQTSGPVLVFTDRATTVNDERAIVVPPGSVPPNIGIVSLSARETPAPQVMVRLRNQSPLKSCRLRLSSGDTAIEQTIELQPTGETTAFIKLPAAHFADMIEAELVGLTPADDTLDADNRAWLVRGSSWGKIEPRSPLSPELRRMVDIYQHARPAIESSDARAVISIVNDSSLGANEIGVIVIPPTSTPAATTRNNSDALLQVAADTVTQFVDWPAVARGVTASGQPPTGPDWSPLVSVGGRVVVARRTEPARQLWVGIDSPTWASTPDFVIFWTNAFDWLGGGNMEFKSAPVHRLGPGWKAVAGEIPAGVEAGLWPGIYERDGVRVAINANASFSPMAATDWETRLARIVPRYIARSAAMPLLIAATILVLGGIWLWSSRGPGTSRVRFSGRTFAI